MKLSVIKCRSGATGVEAGVCEQANLCCHHKIALGNIHSDYWSYFNL